MRRHGEDHTDEDTAGRQHARCVSGRGRCGVIALLAIKASSSSPPGKRSFASRSGQPEYSPDRPDSRDPARVKAGRAAWSAITSIPSRLRQIVKADGRHRGEAFRSPKSRRARPAPRPATPDSVMPEALRGIPNGRLPRQSGRSAGPPAAVGAKHKRQACGRSGRPVRRAG